MGAIVGGSTFISALVIDRIAGVRLSPAEAAKAGPVAGSLLGLLAGYLLQPRRGPV